MPIQTSCPGCGGPIYIEDSAGKAVCQFCGTRFKVDLGETSPRLQKDTRPAAAEIPPDPGIWNQPADEWHPPQPEPPGAQYTPPQAVDSRPAPVSSPNKLFGGRIWIVIALVVTAVVVASCICLVLASRLLFGT